MPDPQPTISISYHPDAPERREIRAPLRQWTRDHADQWQLAQHDCDLSLTIVMKDQHGAIVGGIFGDAFLGCFTIYALWLADEFRNQGHGTKLMHLVEQHARKEGCRTITLDTFDFQAPKFYQKLGFQEFGRVQYFPNGPSKVYLSKTLD